MTFVRKTVPWNIEAYPSGHEYQAAVQWMADLHAYEQATGKDLTPMIAFERCRYSPEDPSGPPESACVGAPDADNSNTGNGYIQRIPQFRQDPNFAEITVLPSWNEPNNGLQKPNGTTKYQPTASISTGSQPLTDSGAYKAGTYWKLFHKDCASGVGPPWNLPRCTVAAGEFLDNQMGTKKNHPEMSGPEYLRQYKKGMGGFKPHAWAWHAYTDGKRRPAVRSTTVTKNGWSILRRFLRATKTTHRPVWLTEQGAVFLSGGKNSRLQPKIARGIVRCYDREVWRISDRINRFSYYQWKGDTDTDSGLRADGPRGDAGDTGQTLVGPNELFNIYRDRGTNQSCPNSPAPAFATVAVLDTGAGANGALDSGDWAAALGLPPMQRNANTLAGGSSPSASSWTTSFGPDQEAYATISSLDSTGELFVRASGANSANATGYSVEVADDEVKIKKTINGTTTVLDTQPHTFSPGDGIGASVDDDVITVYSRNSADDYWTELDSVTDSSITTGGTVVLKASDNGVAFTDFGAGNPGSVGFPEKPVLDSGAGADGALGSPNWETVSGLSALQRSSNTITADGSSISGSSWTTSFGPDQEAYVSLATAGSMAVLLLRGTDLDTADPNGYVIEAGGGDVAVAKYVNGAWSQITSWPHAFADADGLGAKVVGNTITVYYRTGASGTWTQLGTTTDSSITGGGRIALRGDSTAVSFTDFGGGTVS